MNKKLALIMLIPFLFACERNEGSSDISLPYSYSEEDNFNLWNEGRKKAFERKDDFYMTGTTETYENDVFKKAKTFFISRKGLSFYEKRFESEKPRKDDGLYEASQYNLVCLKEMPVDGEMKYVLHEETYSPTEMQIKSKQSFVEKDYLDSEYHAETPKEEFEGMALEGFDTYQEFQNVFQNNAIAEFGTKAKDLHFERKTSKTVSFSYSVYLEHKEDDMGSDYLYTAVNFHAEVVASSSFIQSASYEIESIAKYAEGKEEKETDKATLELRDSFDENGFNDINVR